MQPGEKQLGEMQLGEMQHFNTTPLGEMQPGEMQFEEMQLSPSNIFNSNNEKNCISPVLTCCISPRCISPDFI
ncbi:hypothetical protein U3516DRAFT_755728 [Neocallimastix sp. 'constans']